MKVEQVWFAISTYSKLFEDFLWYRFWWKFPIQFDAENWKMMYDENSTSFISTFLGTATLTVSMLSCFVLIIWANFVPKGISALDAIHCVLGGLCATSCNIFLALVLHHGKSLVASSNQLLQDYRANAGESESIGNVIYANTLCEKF